MVPSEAMSRVRCETRWGRDEGDDEQCKDLVRAREQITMRHRLDQMTSNLPVTLAVLSRGRMLSTLSSLDPPAASVVTHHAGCALPRGAVPFGPAEGGGG